MTDESLEVTIVDGPSSDGFLLWKLEPNIRIDFLSQTFKRRLNFRSKMGGRISVTLTFLDKDDQGTNRILEGRIESAVVRTDDDKIFEGSYPRFAGDFNVKTREGKFTLIPR